MIENNLKQICLSTNITGMGAELADIVRLFLPVPLSVFEGEDAQDGIICTATEYGFFAACGKTGLRYILPSLNNGCAELKFCETRPRDVPWCGAVGLSTNADEKKYIKKHAKLALYYCMKREYNSVIPWGALTGVRPTKLLEELNITPEEFAHMYDVSIEKAFLARAVLDAQKGYKDKNGGVAYLYVGVPFCVSKCSYCSFSGGILSKMKDYVEPYIDALVAEIGAATEGARRAGVKITRAYIGGGTPTTLTPEQLGRVLSALPPMLELTVEAGRPDTLTDGHVSLFSERNVTRVSVNPQTFNPDTLLRVNRKHTVEDIYDCYSRVLGKFDVNMDLIAGLPGESLNDFIYSLECAKSLLPTNITVHTLALKSGSILKEQLWYKQEKKSGNENTINVQSAESLINIKGAENKSSIQNAENAKTIQSVALKVESLYFDNTSEVSKMVEYARQSLCARGYIPYYLYRQKYMSDNLENVGYCLPGKQCAYNIGIMEETVSIVACGSGAVSKRFFADKNLLTRQANAKDVALYIARREQSVQNKLDFFKTTQTVDKSNHS